MTEGISKERFEEILIIVQENKERYFNQNLWLFELDMLRRLISECKELDPWLAIESAPKDQDLLITDKSKRKYIGRLFSSGIWCINGKLDFIPTHYKLSPEDPKE